MNASASLFGRMARGAGWIAALRLATRSLGFVSTLVLARFLVPADFGLVALALAAQQAVDTLAFIGVDEALIREKAPDRALYDTGFTLNVLRGVAIALALWAVAVPMAAGFGEPRLVAVLGVLGVAVAIGGAANVALVDYWREMDFARELELTILPRAVAAVVAIAIGVIWHSYWALVVGVLVQNVLRCGISYRVHVYRPCWSLRALDRLLRYSLWSSALSVAVVLRDRAGVFLIGRVLDRAALGVFSIGWDVASMPTTELIAPLSRAAYSGFAAARHEGEDVTATYLRVVGNAALLALPLGFGLSLVAGPLVCLLYGARWGTAVPVVQVLAAVCGATIFGYLAWTVVYAQGRLAVCFGVTLAVSLLRLGLLWGGAGRFGVRGAAWATAVSLLAESGLYLVQVVRHHGVRPGQLFAQAWRPCLGVAAMAAGMVWLGLGWGVSPADEMKALRQLALAVPTGAMIYGIVVMSLWFLCGRPNGAEADIVALTGRLAGKDLLRAPRA